MNRPQRMYGGNHVMPMRKITSRKVYVMKTLFELHTKQNSSISTHQHMFNTLIGQLQAQRLNFFDNKV